MCWHLLFVSVFLVDNHIGIQVQDNTGFTLNGERRRKGKRLCRKAAKGQQDSKREEQRQQPLQDVPFFSHNSHSLSVK